MMIVLLLAIQFGHVEGNEQGLSWGVEVSQTTEYDIIARFYGVDAGRETVSMTVENLPAIPLQIANWTEIPVPPVEVEFANGTEMTNWTGWAPELYTFVLPVGNWSLLRDLAEEAVPDSEVEQNPDLARWELKVRENTTGFTYNWARISYSTEDGLLKGYHFGQSYSESGEHIYELIIDWHNPLFDRDLPLETLIYISYTVFLVASGVVCIKIAERLENRQSSGLGLYTDVLTHTRYLYIDQQAMQKTPCGFHRAHLEQYLEAIPWLPSV